MRWKTLIPLSIVILEAIHFPARAAEPDGHRSARYHITRPTRWCGLTKEQVKYIADLLFSPYISKELKN